MPMTGFIFQDKYLVRLEKLSDQEVGRLVRALAKYHATGETQELKGRECGYYDFIKADIDEVESAYAAKCRTNKKNRQGLSTNDNECQRPSTTVNESAQNININEKYLLNDNENTRTREDGLFGLTDEDIQASLDRDQQIEDAARGAGLNVSETTMITARRYADEHGLDKLLDAIKKTALGAQRPSWAYVEGVLKNNGRPEAQYRGNHSGNAGNGGTSGKYAHLFDGTSV